MTRSSNLLILATLLSLTVSIVVTGKPTEELKPLRREVYGEGTKIYDISHRYSPELPAWDSKKGMVGSIWLAASMKNGSFANVSEMKFSVHSGTHVDAPGHFIDEYYDAGFDCDSLDLETLNGPALLVDVPRDKNITAEVMESLHLPKGVRRVLFRTVNTDKKLMFQKEFDSSFAGFMTDGAKWLVENTDIKLVGLDYLSFAAYEQSPATHKVILKGRDIIPVEALKLDDVPAGMYSLHCLPLRLVNSEGAPTRCILIK